MPNTSRSTSGRRSAQARTFAGALRAAMRPGAPGLVERGRALPRMVRAAARGDYRQGSMRLLMMAAAAAYIVSPVDLLPEALLGVFGLADDAVVLAWLAGAFVTSTEDFLQWEAATPDVVRSQVTMPGGPQDASTADWGVRG